MGVVAVRCDVHVLTVPLDFVPILVCLRNQGSLVAEQQFADNRAAERRCTVVRYPAVVCLDEALHAGCAGKGSRRDSSNCEGTGDKG